MDFSPFDSRKYKTLGVREGYREWAATYEDTVKEQLDLTETTQDVLGAEAVFQSTDIIGDSTNAALDAAQAWLARPGDDEAE